jgi:hypothetical protein
MNRVVTLSPDAQMEQLFLRAVIDEMPGLRLQLGQHAYDQLIDVVMFLSDAQPVSTIWIETLFPVALNGIERAHPEFRQAIGRVRQVLEDRRWHGVRLTAAEQRQTACAFDTREERRGER